MPRAGREIPPPLELLCLRALWTLGEGRVKDVRQVVAASRPLAYTTIMTVLERLVKKGRLTRRRAGRAFVYAPAASRDALRQVAVRELLDGFFDGSAQQLLAYLQGKAANPPAAGGAGEEADVRLDTALL
jgi:BlaI family transcriptional regulator, penicillinase repressor